MCRYTKSKLLLQFLKYWNTRELGVTKIARVSLLWPKDCELPTYLVIPNHTDLRVISGLPVVGNSLEMFYWGWDGDKSSFTNFFFMVCIALERWSKMEKGTDIYTSKQILLNTKDQKLCSIQYIPFWPDSGLNFCKEAIKVVFIFHGNAPGIM